MEPLAQFPRGRVSDMLAKNFNESRKTFERKREIWKSKNPRKLELIEDLNKGKAVSSAYARLRIFDKREKLEQAIRKQSRPELPEEIKIGDALELLKQVPVKSIDCTLTSPPFVLDDADYMLWFAKLLTEIRRVTIDYALIFNSSTRLTEICRATNPFRTLIWYKGITQEPFRYEPIFAYKMESARFNINSRIQRDILQYSPPQPGERLHRDQNPPELYEELIQITAAETILDSFLGSGTTYKVCTKLGKKCVGFEIERKYLPFILAA